ncbi:Flp family type IVb pilin [Sinorhizobium meliloti]|jgi:pilus assembly protein Flp/PilA|uniref:Flp family type IVb pilin n=1 Tax=Rhizobium meliloti TaxID=382 RepID=UPI000FD24F4A|nr:Flp family type IVb pilin [Sinorhizobium meliloti]MDW9668088.1 Flp family type IVb pilin [Sinorhizobium meliloti]RVM05387.1 Flp family type IVb pilin [Sinorhizobium meliloti]RVM39206.1 Flp family type IVb pilin [Sinorhizobium meliloti]RVM59871.1 Flp family type IVb pilin [Sinorhizobium meliloti]RVM66100.1 Flp family type IVb pilin [Sinorhizobium meliloti]
MKKLFSKLVRDESGATAIEYGLIAALISVALIAGAGALGDSLNTTFDNLSTTLDDNQPPAAE